MLPKLISNRLHSYWPIPASLRNAFGKQCRLMDAKVSLCLCLSLTLHRDLFLLGLQGPLQSFQGWLVPRVFGTGVSILANMPFYVMELLEEPTEGV